MPINLHDGSINTFTSSPLTSHNLSPNTGHAVAYIDTPKIVTDIAESVLVAAQDITPAVHNKL